MVFLYVFQLRKDSDYGSQAFVMCSLMGTSLMGTEPVLLGLFLGWAVDLGVDSFGEAR
jgi:hypothetical protein